MPTAIVAEDEQILRTQLEAKLGKLWPDLEIIASVGDGPAALEALEDRVPDFMFLDIRMPEMTGVEVARLVGGRDRSEEGAEAVRDVRRQADGADAVPRARDEPDPAC